ncbi:MAG: Mfa1 family fimbria major subunit [Alistipes sp.]|nr:Mfa1 family fimbria major subunit [Alistipes sp.]
MRKFLALALAAFAFAACSEKGEEGTQGLQKGELEQSYLTITLAADNMGTRAHEGEYEEGTDAERAVKSAYVFFFDENGNAFDVSFDQATNTTTHGGGSNYLKVNLEKDGSDMSNTISDIHKEVLIINNYRGEYPAKILAILNWTPEKSSYKLSELQAKVTELGNDTKGFVMSNSVYANSKNQVVDAVPLTIANIGDMKPNEEPDPDKVEPVTIHVERVAAKVIYSADKEKFAIGKNVNNTEIYAQIKGFELYNDYEESWLLKRIDPTWTNIGFSWNDADWFRSFWAKSLGKDFTDNTFDWDNDNSVLNSMDYLGENTRPEVENRTKVIVKAQLVDVDGNPIEITNWYGKEYVGENNLKVVVANTLQGLYFWGDGYTFTGAAHDDLQCIARQPEDENAYEVYFQLSNNGSQKSWYKYENGNYNPIDVDDLNAELAQVQPALVYKNGMTYYWLDIKHLGNEDTTAEYGVVRNHVYKVNISDIKGFGTPIYDSEEDFIVPDKPEDVVSYVYAQINILSWRIVENNYEI